MSQVSCPYLNVVPLDKQGLRDIEHLLYWGLVINFNPTTRKVDTFIPPRMHNAASAVSAVSAPIEPQHRSPPPLDTELLGCNVKMHGVRGMVDSITAGENRTIVFQVQFSDGHRLLMSRRELEPILMSATPATSAPSAADSASDTSFHEMVHSFDYQDKKRRKFVVSPFHTAVVSFMENSLQKTHDPSQFVTYQDLMAAFEDSSGMAIHGASMWFRNYVQKTFRVTYITIDTSSKEMVLFGSKERGLRLVT